MEKRIIELSRKVEQAYNSCSLKSVAAFNPYQFHKMMDVLSREYFNKGVDEETFKIIVNNAIINIGGIYVYQE